MISKNLFFLRKEKKILWEILWVNNNVCHYKKNNNITLVYQAFLSSLVTRLVFQCLKRAQFWKKLKIRSDSWSYEAKHLQCSHHCSRWRCLTFSSCSMQAVWTTILQTAHFLLRADFYNIQFKIQEEMLTVCSGKFPGIKESIHNESKHKQMLNMKIWRTWVFWPTPCLCIWMT